MKILDVMNFIQSEKVVCKETIVNKFRLAPPEVEDILNLLSSHGFITLPDSVNSCKAGSCTGCVSFCGIPKSGLIKLL